MQFDQIIIIIVLFYLKDKNVHKHYTDIFNILFNAHKKVKK